VLSFRIFCAVRHANSPGCFYGGLWSGNFYPALRELGHEIVESQVDLLPTSRFMHVATGFTPEEIEARAWTTERILQEVRTAHKRAPLHLFLSYFYNSHFDPAGFDEIRRLGIPSANFYCNSIHQFDNVSAIAAAVDFSWHAEKHARDAYLTVGARPIWIQMAADPAVYRPLEGIERVSKACFIGQRYADRDRWAAGLIGAGVPLDLYGAGWGSDGECFPHERGARPNNEAYLGREYSHPGSGASYLRAVRRDLVDGGLAAGSIRILYRALYRQRSRALGNRLRPHARGRAGDIAATLAKYKVCLNFSNVWADGRPGSPLIAHIRLRDFEAPMCRACYITGYTDEIAEFYDIGKEIDTYRSEEELIDKVRFYLGHAAAADRLREAGYRRAVRDHTWVQRFHQLFAEIGLPTPGDA
jgi:hypothetical protein